MMTSVQRRILPLWLATLLMAAAPPPAAGIGKGLDTIRTAALAHDAAAVAPLLDEAVTVVSQSGKVYDKAALLADIGGGFEAWDNSEVQVREQGDLAVVTFVNARKRAQTDAARFRVMQVWKRQGGQWKMIAQSSVRLPAGA